MKAPEQYLFNESHLWCCREESGVYRIGVSDFAQESLGEIMYVDLPTPGAEVRKGESFGTVESPKVVSELYSPISGTIMDVNEELAGNPGLVNEEPQGKGWMLRVQIASEGDLEDLMDAPHYQGYVNKE